MEQLWRSIKQPTNDRSWPICDIEQGHGRVRSRGLSRRDGDIQRCRSLTPCCRVVQVPIGPLFWNVHYTPIGRSARILSSVSLNSLVHSLSEFGLSLTIAAHQRLH
jgi:hypothetical protein